MESTFELIENILRKFPFIGKHLLPPIRLISVVNELLRNQIIPVRLIQ